MMDDDSGKVWVHNQLTFVVCTPFRLARRLFSKKFTKSLFAIMHYPPTMIHESVKSVMFYC